VEKLCTLVVLMIAATLPLTVQDETKPADPPTGTATAVFYRYQAFLAGGRRATVNVDGEQICSLTNGSVYRIILPVGTHTITGSDKHKGAEVKMTAGTTYYFRAAPGDPAPFKVHNLFVIVPVPPEQGAFEARSLKALDAANVKHY
jgi:hypothetical protein